MCMCSYVCVCMWVKGGTWVAALSNRVPFSGMNVMSLFSSASWPYRSAVYLQGVYTHMCVCVCVCVCVIESE